MKIAFCNNNLSGFYAFRKDIAKYFHQQGHEVILLYPQLTEDHNYLARLSPYCRCIPVSMQPSRQNAFEDYALYKEIKRIYIKERPDIVFNYTIKPNIYSGLAAHSLGIKVVSMMAGLGYVFSGNSIKKRMMRLFYQYGLSVADKVVVLNKSNYETILDSYVDREKLFLFPGGEGVNMSEYPYKENCFDEVHFLMVARLLYDKGYQEFVDAAKIVKRQYPDVHFELLGALSEESPTGVPKAQLEEDIRNGAIEYLGVTNNVPSVVSREGVVVVVASFYMEGMNRALMEACSMGRPIITTDMPGCREMVENGKSGFCIKPHDVRSLAEACLHFISLSEMEKREMSKASFEKCKSQFDVKSVINYYNQIIADLLPDS